MTHSRTRGGSSLRVTWLAFDLHVAFPHSKKFVYMSALITWRAHIHKVTLSSEWHASFFWVTNLSSESHDSFFPVTWLIFSLHPALTYLMWIVFVCSHMTWIAFGLHSCIRLFVYVPRMSLRICLLFVSYMSYLSVILRACLFVFAPKFIEVRLNISSYVTWLIHMCEVTLSCKSRDSPLVCV